jgi:hypothetical protein
MPALRSHIPAHLIEQTNCKMGDLRAAVWAGSSEARVKKLGLSFLVGVTVAVLVKVGCDYAPATENWATTSVGMAAEFLSLPGALLAAFGSRNIHNYSEKLVVVMNCLFYTYVAWACISVRSHFRRRVPQ